jgi:hypothetical protein
MNWLWACVAGFCYLAAAGVLVVMIAKTRQRRAADIRQNAADIAKSLSASSADRPTSRRRHQGQRESRRQQEMPNANPSPLDSTPKFLYRP